MRTSTILAALFLASLGACRQNSSSNSRAAAVDTVERWEVAVPDLKAWLKQVETANPGNEGNAMAFATEIAHSSAVLMDTQKGRGMVYMLGGLFDGTRAANGDEVIIATDDTHHHFIRVGPDRLNLVKTVSGGKPKAGGDDELKLEFKRAQIAHRPSDELLEGAWEIDYDALAVNRRRAFERFGMDGSHITADELRKEAAKGMVHRFGPGKVWSFESEYGREAGPYEVLGDTVILYNPDAPDIGGAKSRKHARLLIYDGTHLTQRESSGDTPLKKVD